MRSGHNRLLEAGFRGDADVPGDPTNQPVIDVLARRLLELRLRREEPAYLDLRRPSRWRPEDLADLGGLGPRLDGLVERGGPLLLGGVTAIWVYSAALHRILARRPEARVLQFDPKLMPGVPAEIPAAVRTPPGSAFEGALSVSWRPEPELDRATLDLQITTPDRILPPDAFMELDRAPLPAGHIPAGRLVVSGKAPIWLHLTYSRWLRNAAPGRPIGHWDGSTESPIFVA